MRFHLDENCHRAVAEGLRCRGIDVTTSAEVGLLQASDEEQFAHATRENRVLFSHDSDILRLNAAGASHTGVAFCAKDSKSLGAIIDGLVLIWELLEPEEMHDHLEYI